MARGPSPIYKKRFVSIGVTVSSSVPAVLGKIVLAETGTIVSAKLSLTGWHNDGAIGRVQEARIFIYCRRAMATDTPPDSTTTVNNFVISFEGIEY